MKLRHTGCFSLRLLFGLSSSSFLMLSLPSGSLAATTKQQRVVDPHVLYGTDDRKNEDNVTDAMRALGRSTAMLVDKSHLERSNNTDASYTILVDKLSTYAEYYGPTQCSGEPWPFADELLLGDCSASLIGGSNDSDNDNTTNNTNMPPQYIATAGHCVIRQAHCDNYYVVFGATAAQIATGVLPAANVYECAEIVATYFHPYHQFADTAGQRVFVAAGLHDPQNLGMDFAVLQLDRPVDPAVAVPVPVRTQGRVRLQEDILLVGHPDGMPRKYARSRVNYVGPLLPTGGYHWTAPLDSFAGNSGSAVFSLETGELVGIHVYGEVDYAEPDDSDNSNCQTVVRQCNDLTTSVLDDPDFVNEVLALDDDEFVARYPHNLTGDCSTGEWQDGSTILSAVLVSIRGCTSDDDCWNGGVCRRDENDNNADTKQTCDCPDGYFGADCSQAKSRFVCQGVGENVDYMTCDCPPGTSPPLCALCQADDHQIAAQSGGTCYNYDWEPLDADFCTCHETCASCGLNYYPSGAGECLTCYEGGVFFPGRDADQGRCLYPDTENDNLQGCYGYDSDLLEGCECHESCASCGFYFRPNDAFDCVTCKPGGRLVPYYYDGTGSCEYDNDNDNEVATTPTCPSALTPFMHCGQHRCAWDLGDYQSHWDQCITTLNNLDCDAASTAAPVFDLCGPNDAAAFADLLDCPTRAPATPTAAPSGVVSEIPSWIVPPTGPVEVPTPEEQEAPVEPEAAAPVEAPTPPEEAPVEPEVAAPVEALTPPEEAPAAEAAAPVEAPTPPEEAPAAEGAPVEDPTSNSSNTTESPVGSTADSQSSSEAFRSSSVFGVVVMVIWVTPMVWW